MERSRSLTGCRKRSSGSSGSSSFLPEELIFKILSWTYVSSLLRCRSVCKLWLSIISQPEFIKAQHINSHVKTPSILMITSKIQDIQDDYDAESYGLCDATIVYPEEDDDDSSVKLPLIPPFNNLVFVSSFNGIACVFDAVSTDDIYLFNPLTNMSKQLPPTTPTSRFLFRLDIAFGFDCVSNDYKVLKIVYRSANILTNALYADVLALNLYSLNSDSWTEILLGTSIALPSLICNPVVPILRSGPVVDGVLYLEAVNTIVTFHLHNQAFGVIPYPSFKHTRKSNLLDFQGSVALVLESVRDGSLDEKEVSLWTMEAVSDEAFWNKIFTFDAGSEEIDWVFLYAGANKFVGKTRLGPFLHDYRKKETKYIRLPSQSFLIKALKHTESFLSVEKVKGVEDS